jgi:hypothetical protein
VLDRAFARELAQRLESTGRSSQSTALTTITFIGWSMRSHAASAPRRR